MTHYPQLTILRHVIMVAGGLYFLLLCRHHHFTFNDLGLHLKQIPRSFTISLSGTLIGIVMLMVAYQLHPSWFTHGLTTLKVVEAPIPILIATYVVLSVPLQELIFRSFLIKRLELITHNPVILIMLSAGLFAIAHIIFGNVYLMIGCFLGGAMWAYLFIKYRNLWPIQVSHAILGSLVIWLGLK